MRSLRRWAWLLLAVGCGAPGQEGTSEARRPPGPHAEPIAATSTAASPSVPAASAEPPPAPPPAPPAPVVEGKRLMSMEVPGFLDAVVAVPVGATGRLPVVVATHGNYDRPEWQCQVWAAIVGARGFVLCPRGVERRDSPSGQDRRYEYGSNQALEREIDAGLQALRQRWPEHVDPGPIVFAGFSLGAIMGTTIAARRPEVFSRLVLIEGGDRWTLAAARAFHAGGGQRVLFACSQGGCGASARVAMSTLRRASVEAELVQGKNEGHTYGGDVMERYAERFSWVIEGDPRWPRSP